MLRLKQDITEKSQVNKLLKLELELNIGENKKYKIEAIKNSAVYIEVTENQLPALYYLVFWNDCLEYKDIWEAVSAIMQF